MIPQTRDVVCYRCGASLPVSGYAESASCPKCAGNLRLLPIEITKGHWGTSLLTTESIVVHEDAQLIANISVASGDIRIDGSAQTMCIAGGTVTISSTGELRGGVRAARIVIEPGAKIIGSVIESPSAALGTLDIDAAARARPGTGPASQIEVLTTDQVAEEPIAGMIVAPKTPHPRLSVVR
ncbi:MAG: polymer-forming cytoskeletal protein [Erythrobacter sp.]|nr:polymer-forming cytoskeletal protein [Erythrobacter sp.]